MGFQFEQHRLGLWDLAGIWKKNNFLGNGIRPPPPLLHDLHEQLKDEPSFLVITDPAGQVTTFASLDALTTLYAYISSK